MMNEAELGAYIDAHFTRTLFRLETLDRYEVASDGGDFARWLEGAAEPTWERKQPWLDQLRREAREGKYSYRVHVVSSPLNDYLRYECEWGYAYNAPAGEDIAILDAAETPIPEVVFLEDFWIIDDNQVVAMRYGDDGQFFGAEGLPPEVLPRYRAARDAAWNASVRFADYWAAHPQYWSTSQVAQGG